MNKLFVFAVACCLLPLCRQEALYAQTTISKPLSTRFDYAVSGTLTVYEKPDVTSKIIGQLIYKEKIQVVIDNAPVSQTVTWLRIVSPYEGYFLVSEPVAGVIGMDALGRKPVATRTDKKAVETESAQKTETDASSPMEDQSAEQTASIPSITGSMEAGEVARHTVLIGLGAGIYTVAEEQGYQGSGIPLDLFCEWADPTSFLANFRLGINSASSKEDDYTIATNSIYLVYRLPFTFFEGMGMDFYGIGGPAWMLATLSGDADESASGFGMVVGGGAVYPLIGDLKVGGQIVYFTAQLDFDVVKRYAGSTQLQMLVSYGF